MKFLLFLLIISVLGSLKNQDCPPCEHEFVTKYYSNGKYIKTNIFQEWSTFKFKYPLPLNVNNDGKYFDTDSIMIKPIKKPRLWK